jgi:O-antigen/teichoic acid export membrane protein
MKIDTIRRQSLVSFVLSLLTTFFGLISTMYFAHVLGPVILGIYFLFISYFGIFQFIGDSGVGYAAVKRISEGTDQHEYYSAYIILRWALVLVSIICILILAQYVEAFQAHDFWILLIISLIVSSIFNIISVDIYALDKVGIYQTGVFFNFLIKILFQAVFVFTGFALGGLIWGFILGYIAGLIFYLYFAELKYTGISKFHMKNLVEYSLWVSFSNNAIFLLTTIQVIIIGILSTNLDVGIFSTSMQLTSAELMFTMAVCAVIYPKISLWHVQQETKKIAESLAQSFTYSLVFALPIAFGGIILGDWLLYYLYGSSFQSGYNTLIVLFFVQLVSLFLYLQITVLNAMNYPRKIFSILLISLGLLVIMNYVLNYYLGVIGFPIALLITFLVLTLVFHRILSGFVDMSFDVKNYGTIFFSAMVMAIILLGMKVNVPSAPVTLGLLILIGALVYFFILFAFNHQLYREIKNLLVQMC